MLSIDVPAGTRPDLSKPETPLIAKTVRSPIGPLRLVASELGLIAVLWPEERPGRVPLDATVEGTSPLLEEAAVQLDAYFAGRLQSFDLPLDMRGTPFQREVWTMLRAIPYGETRSYRDMAVALGRPTATRAVGAANGRNPISIIVPCHRVVGANGTLTGFAGGLAAKEHLLALEGARLF